MATIPKPLLLDETYREGNAALINILENITTATNKAAEATASADTAIQKADIATAKADIATAKADIATAKADIATAKADEASTSAVSAQNAANAAEAVAPEYAKTKEVLENIVNYTNTATEQANLATAKADAANASAINAAQSYANADSVATQLTEYLATKESLTAPAVDKTLLIEGAAADSKVTGSSLNELKSDLDNLKTTYEIQDDGTIRMYPIWEHGWISGSGTVSKRTDRCITSDYFVTDANLRVTCEDGYLAYIDYFDEDYNFVTYATVGSSPVGVSTAYKYFKLLFHKADSVDVLSYKEQKAVKIWFTKTYNNSLYNVAQSGKYQIYTEYGEELYTEEDIKNKIAFFYQNTWYVRVGVSKTIYWSTFCEEVGREPVVSTNNISNCCYLTGTEILVYNITENKYTIKDRYEITIDDILLIAQVNGHIIYTSPYLLSGAYIFNYLKSRVMPKEIDYYYNKKKYWMSVNYNSDFKCLFFSDIHASKTNMHRIVRLANKFGSSNINAVINGGDTVDSTLDEGLSWYDSLVDLCDIDVLTCAGNHDEYTGSYGTPALKTDVYNAIIAPVVSKVSDIVQPDNASTNGLCYYYKDYGKVRVIIIDAIIGNINAFDTLHETWLKNVLEDANINNKSVICVSHSPFNKSDPNVVRDELCNWNSFIPFSNIDSQYTDYKAFNAVAEFIENGGDFVCWLTGHSHFDNLLTNTNFPKQLVINISTAKYNRHYIDGAYDAYLSDTGLYDCINYIGVDTTNKLIKVWRIGYNIDGGMKERNTLCYDYANKRVISST